MLSLVIFIGSTTAATVVLFLNRDKLPLTLKVTHFGVCFVLVGAVIEAGTIIATGEPAGFGIDNLISMGGFIAISCGMFYAAVERNAVSGGGDILDAIASVTFPTILVLSFVLPASMDLTSNIARLDAIFFTSISAIMLGVMFLLMYGAGYRSVGTTWAAAAGLYAAAVTGISVVADVNDLAWRPEMARFYGLGFVFYLMAVTHPTWSEFATPGTRKQSYRWRLYLVVAVALLGWSFYHWDAIAASGLAVFAATGIARLRLAHITNCRLSRISDVHSMLATNLAVTNTVDEALEAGRLACLSLIDNRHNVTVTTVAAKGHHFDFMPEDSFKIVRSEAATTQVHSEGTLQSFEIVAFEQIATVVDFAVGSVELRAQDAARVAKANWFESAKHDANTGLLNMRDFESLDLISADLMIAFYFPDVSRVNGTSGQDAGEELMNMFATRLWTLVRAEDILWRGEGSSLILAVKSFKGDPVEWVESRREKMARVIDLGEHSFVPTVTASVLQLEHPIRPASAIVRLDMAARHASDMKVFQPTIMFSDEIERQISRRWKIESAFASALRDPESNGFEVYYQPIINARTKKVEGLEALARWNHEELGYVSPAEFIPAAERAGLVSTIDSFVLNCALRDMDMLHAASPTLRIQVNMSPVSLNPSRIREAANTVMLQRGKSADVGIVFEIIESALGAQKLSEMREAMSYCRDIGIGLSLDDFGTGESNFDRIGKLPFTQVKLANEFSQSGDALLIESMLRTISDLGMESVVEGVETKDQLDMVTAAGASQIQGWYFAKAEPLDKTFDFLLERKVAESKRPRELSTGKES